jgi:purine-binding chemotaxis protein CheW
MEVLLFSLADEKFCIPLTFVEAIEHTARITPVPKAKKYIVGLVNIRGNIIPVVDMAVHLGLNKMTALNKFILIKNKKHLIAFIADDVDDVINIDDNNIEKVTMDNSKFSLVNHQNVVATLIGQDELDKI